MATAQTDESLTIDDLARQVQLPVRTIREYHTMRLLPPPERRGRLGLYGTRHVQRLQLITRLQRRGYSLAGIRDLLGAWENGTDLTTLLGVDQSQAALDETPLRLSRAELFQRLPALDPAALDPGALDPGALDPGALDPGALDPGALDPGALDRARQTGLVRPYGEDHFVVRSPALLGLVADWVEAGVPLDQALDVIEVLTGDLGVLAGKLAGLIVGRVWDPVSATSRAGQLPNMLRRGRPLLLQGAASTLADRLGAALAECADTADDGGRLRAALDDIQVGAITDSTGTIHRRGDRR
jgi:DNA-binding transcriptional MerR regulator